MVRELKLSFFNIFQSKKIRKVKVSKKNCISKMIGVTGAGKNLDNVLKNTENVLQKITGLEIINYKIVNNIKSVIVCYNGNKYILEFKLIDYWHDDGLLKNGTHFDVYELEKLRKANKGLLLSMDYDNNNFFEAFFLQIKIISVLVDDLCGIVDLSAGRVLSPKWIEHKAKYENIITCNSLYSIELMRYKDNIWIYTHGLNRLGLAELEIIGYKKNDVNFYYKIIEEYANFLIYEKLVKKDVPFYYKVGDIINVGDLILTNINWKRGIKLYKDNIIREFQREENNDVNIVFWTKNVNDNNYKRLDELDPSNTVLYNFICDDITSKNKLLASQEFNTLKNNFNGDNAEAFVFIRETRISVWIKVLNIADSSISGKIIDGDNGLSEEIEVPLSDLLYWVININNMQISAEEAYILDDDN